MNIICTDLEGVFSPEIWINIAEKTGINELRITTRDEPDYNKLMRRRIEILKDNNIRIEDIKKIISEMTLLPGAEEFVAWLKKEAPVIVVSDTFLQFADPIMKKLGYPALFCNRLEIDKDGFIVRHVMRQENGKQKVAEALKNLNYRVIAVGDSYNDINMLKTADYGILFLPPKNVEAEFPQFKVAKDYAMLKSFIKNKLE